MIKILIPLHVYSIVVFAKHFVTAPFLQQNYLILKSPLDQNYTRLMMSSGESTQCIALKRDLSEWEYAAPKLLQLPIEMVKENFVRRNIKDAVFSLVLPTPLKKNVKLVAYSKDVLTNILDMDPSITEKTDFAEFIAGNKILDSSTPLAHRYGGHQFGVWAQQLGDGRAHLLGEYINQCGEHWELQLKGSGMTPYSRGGDGRAVLRSSIREFLCSEAMHYLGVPTSRAAALVVSEDLVQRDMFYRGNMQLERAAVVLRLAPTWFRFGSLEILTRNGEFDTLRLLVDYIIQEHFPEIEDDGQKYVEFFTLVAYKTMDLVVMWENVGFTHGVLNTDNMSLLGITIDYGPFGFVEAYDPLYVPNSSDNEGRYAFIKQPEIALWNLERLSFALGPLLSESHKFQIAEILSDLMVYVQRKQRANLCLKLGLELGRDIDYQLVVLLIHIMEATGADYTATFSQLGQVTMTELFDPEVRARHWAIEQLSTHEHFPSFLKIYAKRMEGCSDEDRMKNMQSRNPRYVLKNWMAQSAIAQAEQDDFEEVNLLLEVLRQPFTVNEEAEKRGYSGPPPKWARNIRVSCSS